MGSKLLLIGGVLVSVAAIAAIPRDRRVILTSGEKVFTIHYQLGESTVLYFGQKPETVICGNKNYFTIDKIKEGVTIQPLANFSTNLTVMSQGKRFLFYLVPANGAPFDTFIDVRWVPEGDRRSIPKSDTAGSEVVVPLKGSIRVGDLLITLVREIRIERARRSIFEFEAKNLSSQSIKSSDVGISILKKGGVREVSLFEQDEIKSKNLGRLILTGERPKQLILLVRFKGLAGRLKAGGSH
jgi:hypothetical protein